MHFKLIVPNKNIDNIEREKLQIKNLLYFYYCMVNNDL